MTHPLPAAAAHALPGKTKLAMYQAPGDLITHSSDNKTMGKLPSPGVEPKEGYGQEQTDPNPVGRAAAQHGSQSVDEKIFHYIDST